MTYRRYGKLALNIIVGHIFVRLEVRAMNYFPNGDEEVSLVKFIAKYQYLRVSDAEYFFKTNKYYKNRIKSLID